MTTIGISAFTNCSSLTSITIPSSVTSIGLYAFQDCSSLTSITIPNSVTSIKEAAFYNCSDLTSITIPNSVTSIGGDAFANTKWVEDQPDGLLYLNNWLLGYKGSEPTGNLLINESTKGIADGAFFWCDNLTTVSIPASVTSIGNEAFEDCSNLSKVYVLRSESVPTLGDDVFKKCNENLAIVVPAAVKSNYETGWSAYSTKIKAGYTVTCAEGITATSNAPIVAEGETVTLGNTKSGYFCGGYELSAGTLDNTTTNTTTFTMPDQDVHVTADFIPNSQITTVNNWAELKNAINDVAIIKLDGDDVYYAEGTSISISFGTVTIYGDGHTIDAQRLNARIFEVESGATLTLKNLILKNVTQTGDGGAIYNDGGTLNVANCTFTNNTATTEKGAAIYNKEGTLRIVNSRFDKNSKYDRAIYNYGTEGNPFRLTMINCTMIEDKVCVNYEDNERRLDDKRDIDLLTTEFNAVIPEINAERTAVPISLTGIDTFFSGDVTVKLSNPPSVTESDINVSVANGGGNNSVSLGVNQYLARFKNFISLTVKAFEMDGTKPYQQMTFRVVADWATANASTETDPYVINNKDQLDLLAQRVNNGTTYSGKFFKLGADITYSHTTDWDDDNSTENNYTAIGCKLGSDPNTDHHPFSGTFDGDGHTVSGIRIYKSGNDWADGCQGLFGYTDGATVKNVTLTDARITGYQSVGGIIGDASNATLRNNLAIGCAISAGEYRGAIVGNNDGSTTANNYYSGCTVGGSTGNGIGCNGADITANDGAVPAVILSETQTSMPAMTSGDKVVFRREFTVDKASTVCLPFGIDATQAAAAGKFYTFVGVDKSGANWEVIMQETPTSNLVSGDLSANTPYLFKPAATGPVLFHGPANYDATNLTTTDTEGWEFTGTYTDQTWPDGQTHLYGFAAANFEKSDGTLLNDVGAFRRFDYGHIYPFRCYLMAPGYTPARGVSKAGSQLPESMKVRLVSASGEATAIGTLNTRTGEVTFDGDAWYSLDGRRLSAKPTKSGLYINNGKTVVVK